MNLGKTNLDSVQDAATSYGKQVGDSLENAVDSVRDVAHDALAMSSRKIDSLHDKAKPAVERLMARGTEFADAAVERTHDAGLRAKKAVSGYAQACESYIVEKPMKSVAIAAAAGATIAALLMMSQSRKREHARNNLR
jgi:ElaB/YqjD/DUF883 family membrane-anchored ribosome-binding protein